jgi:hypothetical protein
MTRAELLDRMSAAEMAAWRTFYEREPWDGRRIDIAAADLCWLISSALHDPKSGHRRPRVDDFMRDWWGEEKARREDGWNFWQRTKDALGKAERAWRNSQSTSKDSKS